MTRRIAPIPLPPGNWRLDPFTRVLRYVYEDPMLVIPDAFDEPIETAPKERHRAEIKHGTPYGSRTHIRRGEPVCDACRIAERERREAVKRRQYDEGDPRWTCTCGAFKPTKAARNCPSCAITIRYSRTEAA